MKAGRQCGDLVHPLVYCPELHFSEFTSAVADMKNSVAVGVEQGGAGSERPQETAAGRITVPPQGPRSGLWSGEGRNHPKWGRAAHRSRCRHVRSAGTRASSPLRALPPSPPSALSLAPPLPGMKADPVAHGHGPRGHSLLLPTWSLSTVGWSGCGAPSEGPAGRSPEGALGEPLLSVPAAGCRRVAAVLLPQDRDNSPSSCAGLFIASHIGFDWPGVWVHLDIAAPVHAVSPGPRGAPASPR